VAERSGLAAPLVLGSGSPRRHALLDQLGVAFSVVVADVDERPLWSGDVVDSAVRSASAKHRAITALVDADAAVLTADTLVAADGQVLGKPRDRSDARRMLQLCSGRPLVVVTALSSGRAHEAPTTRVVETTVHIAPLSDEVIDEYLATDVALDKAGALELQGAAAGFIERLDGCWSNVVGLPVCAVAELLDLEPAGTPWADRCLGRRCGAGSDR
jgi:septum formation protein